MANKKEFGEGALFTIGNYVWWFLLANMYFLIVNIPFVFIWILSAQTETQGINVLLIICALPIGPALAALFSVMGKLVREKDLDVTKDFFKAYKRNFLEATFFWTIIVIMLTVLYLDVIVIKVGHNFPTLNIVLLIIGVIIITLTLYIFPLISRFYLRKIDVIKLAVIYSIKKIHITIFNWIILIGLILFYTKVPGIMFLFMWSIFGYMIMFFESGILKELEERLQKQYENKKIEVIE